MSYMIKLIAPKFLLRAFCALSIIFFLGHSLKYASSLSGAFIDYYTYSHILIEGKSFERVYDPSFFNTTIATLTQQPIKGFANQPPTNAFALVCLAWLNPVPAKLIYSVLSILAFIGSVLILLVLYDVSPTSDIGIGLISLSFLWRPVYVNTSNSQIFTIILFLFCLSLLALKKGKQGLSTFAFTIPFLIKGFGVIIFLWLTITKRWKALFFSVLLIISCLAISIPLFGLEAWNIYYQNVIATLGKQPSDAHVFFQTINSLVNHLFSFDEKWLPHPLYVLPKYLVTLISYVLNACLIIIVLKAIHKLYKAKVVLSFSVALALGVVSAPLAAEYYYILFLPLVIGLLVYSFKSYEITRTLTVEIILIIASIILMALPIDYVKWNLWEMPNILLAYPKLYAGIVMLILFVSITRTKQLLIHD